MSDKTFQVNIFTPEKRNGSYEATLLVCPCVDGELGVMANHSPMLAALKAGECRITTADGVVKVPIERGILHVKENIAEIITE